MWGDFVGSSLLTDEDFKRLASELESGRVSVNQVRAAVLEAEIEEKTSITKAVAWAIRDMIDEPCDAQSSTTAIPKSSLPERFIVHWCEKKRFCICDLIGWEVK